MMHHFVTRPVLRKVSLARCTWKQVTAASCITCQDMSGPLWACKIYQAAVRRRQSKRVDPVHWIRRIPVNVCSAHQPHRILVDEPPRRRIVVAIQVVVQPRLAIVVLPLKSQRVVDLRHVG